MNTFLALVGVPVGSSEASLADGKKTNIRVLVEGKPLSLFHRRHDWEMVPWDRKKFGPDVTDFTEYYATYFFHWRCKGCGREIIEATRALI